MRARTPKFLAANSALTKSPRHIVNIIFDTGSVYITSHTGISGVPGIVLDGLLRKSSLVSQRLIPDQARSEIGAAEFSVLDKASAFTDTMRTKLEAGKGLRGHTVKFLRGFEGLAFSEFELVGTQIVYEVVYEAGTYTISCRDITRELRKTIFDLATTKITASIPAPDPNNPNATISIAVQSTAKFTRVEHGASYTDAPTALVGYIKIKDEVLRYTATDQTHFLNCTRGVLGTLPAAYEINSDPNKQDRNEQVDEYVYLELPVVKAIYAVMTGILYGQSGATLPTSWHLGIDPAWVRLSDFTGIGTSIWDSTSDAYIASMQCRFEGLSRVDGKSFIGMELLMLIACYSPVYADGALGLKRMNAVFKDSATVMTLDESNSVQASSLTHAMSMLHNYFQVDWNWDGAQFTRRNVKLEATSIDKHGRAEMLALAFKGLHGSRHQDSTIFTLLNMFGERYAGPPEIMSVQLLTGLNGLELGDLVRATYQSVRDYAGPVGPMNRAFEIQNISDDGESLRLELFGSTARAAMDSPDSPTTEVTALPDAFYISQGQNLGSVSGVTITNDVLTVAPGTPINGGATLDDTASIFYHDSNLTIGTGVELKISGNWQLRVKGHLQIDGTINGKGGGHAGVSDSGADIIIANDVEPSHPLITDVIEGVPGWVGHSVGNDGVQSKTSPQGGPASFWHTVPVARAESKHGSAPYLDIVVKSGALPGLAGVDLRGAGGPPGGRVYEFFTNTIKYTDTPGGAGATGGAGICIICRGMSFGAAPGKVILDGNDSVAPSPVFLQHIAIFNYPGTGGGGGPGTLYVLLDGAELSEPVINRTASPQGNFFAKCGAVPVWVTTGRLPQPTVPLPLMPSPAVSGYAISDTSGVQHSFDACYMAQHIRAAENPSADQGAPPPAPVDLFLESAPGMITGSVTLPLNLPAHVLTRVYVSITNNRPDAVREIEARTDGFAFASTAGQVKYLWVSTYDPSTGLESAFFPAGSTTSFSIAASGTGGAATLIGTGNAQVAGVNATKVGGVTAWDSSAYSEDGAVGGAIASFKFGQTNANVMGALNFDPTLDSNYTSLDFAWYGYTDGTAYIYESGNQIGLFGPYTTSTIFSIVYSGSTLKYYMDGALKRTVDVGAGRTLFFDSSIWSPGASIRGISFSALAPVSETRDANVVFLDTFDHQKWESFYNLRFGPGTGVTYPANGLVGGRVLRAAGAELWIAHADNIPYDSNTLYRIMARIRRTAAGGGSGYETCWVGVEGVAADGKTLINESGTDTSSGQHYNCFRQFDLSTIALNEWVVGVGYFRGNATTGFAVAAHVDAPSVLYTGVRYFRPLLILNYNTGTGTQECDFIKIERLPVPDDADNTNKKRLAPDAEFSLAASDAYWYSSANQAAPLPVISVTGGLNGGKCTFTGAATGFSTIWSRRKPSVPAINGDVWTIRCRLRRTATITPSSGQLFGARISRTGLSPDDPQPAVDGLFSLGGIYLTSAALNALAVDTWYEFLGLSYLGNATQQQILDFPHCVLIATFWATGGAVEVDYLDATSGTTTIPERIYTSTAAVDWLERAVYDSGSSGTLTLQTGSAFAAGAFVEFEQRGAGLLTIGAPASGSLFSPVNTSGSRATKGRYSRVRAEARADGNWYMTGDLA